MTSLPVVAERVQTIIAAERAGDEVMRAVRSRLETVDRHPVRPRGHPVTWPTRSTTCSTRCAPPPTRRCSTTSPTNCPASPSRFACCAASPRRTSLLVGRLRTLDDIAVHLDEIDRLETEADSLFRRIMAELFDGNHDALEILKWKDVVEAVERAINAVEEASVVIESIAVKHA